MYMLLSILSYRNLTIRDGYRCQLFGDDVEVNGELMVCGETLGRLLTEVILFRTDWTSQPNRCRIERAH